MPKYGEYSTYEQYRILKYFKYREYSTVSNPMTLRVWQCSHYRILNYCEY